MSTLKEEQEKARQQVLQNYRELHEEWLKNPVTVLLLRGLSAHKEWTVDKVSVLALERECTDSVVRVRAASLAGIGSLYKLITDFKTLSDITINKQ